MYWRGDTAPAGVTMQNDPSFDRLIADGLEASRQQRTEAALQLFAQASAVAPGSGIPHFLIASELAARGEVDPAELAFARAVLLGPEFHLARYQLGLLQFTSQRAPLALLTWAPLFDLPAGEPLHHFVRGFAALAQDGFAEALAHYREGLACQEVNAALAADIQRVVEAVEQLPARGDAEPEGSGAAGHVLLSAYGRGLH